MGRITFRIHGDLNDFLPYALRNRAFQSRFKGRESVKDKIEALGVPHPEVDVILVDGRSVGFDYILEDGDNISVYPLAESAALKGIVHLKPLPVGKPRFIGESNIYDVVKTMRALGLDVVEDSALSPSEIIDKALNEGRIILSSSRQLLKQKRVVHGIFIREGNRELQIQRIVDSLSLKEICRPFSRCLLCNTPLERVAKEKAWERIPPGSRSRCDEFAGCPSCDKLYWRGTHYQKIKAKVDRILSAEFPTSKT